MKFYECGSSTEHLKSLHPFIDAEWVQPNFSLSGEEKWSEGRDGSSSHVSSTLSAHLTLLDFLGHSVVFCLFLNYQPSFISLNKSRVSLFVSSKPQKKIEMMFFFSRSFFYYFIKVFSSVRLCQELAFDNKHHIWQSTILCWNIYLFISWTRVLTTISIWICQKTPFPQPVCHKT